jgi:hypothetical protein
MITKMFIIFISRNEGKYLEEWLSYHESIGIGSFICHLDESDGDDGSRDILMKHGAVIYEGFKPPYQIDFYLHAFRTHRNDADYFAFIDVDEFLFPIGGKLPENLDKGCMNIRRIDFGFNDESEIDLPILSRHCERIKLLAYKQILRSDWPVLRNKLPIGGNGVEYNNIVIHHYGCKTRTEYNLRNSIKNNALENNKRG